MDPSAIRPLGRVAVSRFDPRERAGRIVAPIDGAITSRAPAPHLLHDDPQHSRREAKADTPETAGEPESAAHGEHTSPPSFTSGAPGLPFITPSDVLLIAAEHNGQPPAAAIGAYRPVPRDEHGHTHTDIEV